MVSRVPTSVPPCSIAWQKRNDERHRLTAAARRRNAGLLAAFVFGVFASAYPSPGSAAKIIDIREFDVVPNSGFDASIGIAAAVRAGQDYLSAHKDDRVEIYLPAGRYILRDGIKVPSRTSIIGAGDGETIIYFSPPPQAWGRIAFSTQNAVRSPYIAIARADDPAHPPLPGNSYKDQRILYLHRAEDVAVLRKLGVPAETQDDYAGLEVATSGGATLSNNTEGTVPSTALPAAQLAGEPGSNPAPATLNRILAVDGAGKVTLAFPNRFDWGREFRDPQETLAEYYDPQNFGVHDGKRVPREECAGCKLLSKTGPLAGPGWIVPMNDYTHDVAFENLVFEQDLNRSVMSLQENYLLYLMYVNGAAVRNCKFRDTFSYYPVASVRGFNIDIDRSEFLLSAHAAVTLDAGSNYTIRNSRFKGGDPADALRLGLATGPQHFIIFDEAPIDVTIANNSFENLKAGKGNDGIAIFGVGGTYSRILDNSFSGIERAIFLNVFMNDHVVMSGNSIDTAALIYSGSGTSMAAVSNNAYTGTPSQPQKDVPNFDSYNRTDRRNYVCANRGVVPRQWYRGTTWSAGNATQGGQPVPVGDIVQPLPGWTARAAVTGTLNEEKLAGISVEPRSALEVGKAASVTVTLSQPAASDFPFALEIMDGDVSSGLALGGTFVVPAGAQKVSLPNALLGQRPGEFSLAARSLCQSSVARVSTGVTVSR